MPIALLTRIAPQPLPTEWTAAHGIRGRHIAPGWPGGRQTAVDLAPRR